MHGVCSTETRKRGLRGEELLALVRPERSSASQTLRPSKSRDAVFVGRHRELKQLHAAYRDSLTRAVSMYVRAESGMGKSALVRRFLEELPPTDCAVVLRGRCYEREAVPHKALDAIVRRAFAPPAGDAPGPRRIHVPTRHRLRWLVSSQS